MELDLGTLNDLPDALFVVRGGVIVWASVGAARLLGSERDALVDMPIASVLAEGEQERLETLDAQRKAGWRIPSTSRVRFVRPGDRVEVAADVRLTTDPTTGDMLLSARDAAELIRAEELAAELMRISGAQPDADSYLDAVSDLIRARGWTLAFAEIADHATITRKVISSPGDPVGEYGKSLLGRELPFDRTPIVAEVVRTGRPLFLDNVPTLMSGRVRQAVALAESMAEARVARSAWCPVTHEGRVSHVVAAAGPDLSEYDFIALQTFAARLAALMRKAEYRAELVHRERLAALGEMAAVLAHEIRNPLAVIFNTVSTFRRQITDPSHSQLLEILADEARHLERLTSDLLAWARPPPPAVQASEVAPIVRESVQAARHEPDATENVAIDVELAEDLPLALVDPPLLHRALVNLLTNALQHAPEGGHVRVLGTARDRQLELRVENDGPAIPEADARRIFDPFFTKRARGTGLGLSVVKQLVESMGGKVELESAGNPVRFAIRIPSEAA